MLVMYVYSFYRLLMTDGKHTRLLWHIILYIVIATVFYLKWSDRFETQTSIICTVNRACCLREHVLISFAPRTHRVLSFCWSPLYNILAIRPEFGDDGVGYIIHLMLCTLTGTFVHMYTWHSILYLYSDLCVYAPLLHYVILSASCRVHLQWTRFIAVTGGIHGLNRANARGFDSDFLFLVHW